MAGKKGAKADSKVQGKRAGRDGFASKNKLKCGSVFLGEAWVECISNTQLGRPNKQLVQFTQWNGGPLGKGRQGSWFTAEGKRIQLAFVNYEKPPSKPKKGGNQFQITGYRELSAVAPPTPPTQQQPQQEEEESEAGSDGGD